VLLVLGLVVVLCGGGFGLLAVIGYYADQANKNTTVSTNTTTTTTPGKSGNTSSSNTTTKSSDPTTRKDVTTLNFSMFVQPYSIYGTTEVDGDELLVKANSNIAYYVLAAPDEYTTEDADTRVTVINTTGAICAHGYGLVFHSNTTPLQQGYAFLIDTKRGKYTVVHHEPHKEMAVVNWTSSPAINSGTAENTLEVRDHSGSVDLYINDTKVNTIKNEFGYSGGVAGIYVGQGVKVGFKDFQIKR
jgi:hypothetical protein